MVRGVVAMVAFKSTTGTGPFGRLRLFLRIIACVYMLVCPSFTLYL